LGLPAKNTQRAPPLLVHKSISGTHKSTSGTHKRALGTTEPPCLQVVCETIKAALDQLPGDERTLVGLVTYDAHVHFYNLSARLSSPFHL
jgi:Sec23/Sec24 trunk domain